MLVSSISVRCHRMSQIGSNRNEARHCAIALQREHDVHYRPCEMATLPESARIGSRPRNSLQAKAHMRVSSISEKYHRMTQIGSNRNEARHCAIALEQHDDHYRPHEMWQCQSQCALITTQRRLANVFQPSHLL